MGMKAFMLLALAAAALAPSRALAAGAVSLTSEPVNFDGARARPESDAVRAGSPAEGRSPAQIARDEQAKADSRAAAAAPPIGVDKELEPPKPNEWLKPEHLLGGAKGLLIGALVGSLWGMVGLGIGALIGGLIGYGVSVLAARLTA